MKIRSASTTQSLLTFSSVIALCAITCFQARAQQTFFARWQARASATQDKQPKWSVPVLSPYPTLIQVFRTEFTRQISPTGATTWNLGSSRGLNLIPFASTEFDIFVPPFLEHSDTTRDGFGDLSTAAKYRIAAGNEKHGNYSVAASVTATVPTGSYKNGSTAASISPALSAGKGWKRFDAATTLGATLPVGDTNTIGRTVTTNTYAQYHVGKFFWPEVEVNSTAWYNGTRDGKVQTFITPGLMFGKFAFHPSEPSRRTGLATGVAFQTSATHFYTYNHSLIFTGRFLF